MFLMIVTVQCDYETVPIPLPHKVLWFVPPIPSGNSSLVFTLNSLKTWLLESHPSEHPVTFLRVGRGISWNCTLSTTTTEKWI